MEILEAIQSMIGAMMGIVGIGWIGAMLLLLAGIFYINR